MTTAPSNKPLEQLDLIDVSPPDLFSANGEPRVERANGNGKKPKSAFEPPNLAKAIRLPVPDFSDPNRKLTCLEVDFPIAPINALSKLEGNAGKPIYQMSKWWARRRSSVFRSLLIAAGTEAPANPEEAAKRVWDHYYCNHQKAGSFKTLKVIEPFMGGGTTLVEGARLGFQLTGVDLNPVAWFVTKNELACSDPIQVKTFFDQIEAEVKPLIQPFYTTTCPRGHKGRWIDVRTGKAAPESLDAVDLPPERRKHYRWDGPEVIYTFWAKHGSCAGSQGQPCGHRTPIFRSPIIAEKKLRTYYIPITCTSCGHAFNAELGETRMAPGAERVIVENEPPFTELSQGFAQRLKDYSKGNGTEKRQRVEELRALVDDEPGLTCPHCAAFAGDQVKNTIERHAKPSTSVGSIKKTNFDIGSRPVFMYLLIHPKWMEGTPGKDAKGVEYGGWAGADPKTTAAWWSARLEHLALVEVRGRVKLSEDESASIEEVDSPDSDASESGDTDEAGEDDAADRKLFGPPARVTLADGTLFDTRKGTVPGKSQFRCDADGNEQDMLTSVKQTGHTAPVAPCALQCHCPECDAEGYTYGGRYFAAPTNFDVQNLVAAEHEWLNRKDADLSGCWPTSPCWDAYMMRANGGVNDGWGYTHWWKMFNARQLLVHTQLLRATDAAAPSQSLDVCEQILGIVQQYLRNQNMFCFWDFGYDKLVPMMSNANYHPKSQVVENCAFHTLGRGNLYSARDTVLNGLAWALEPWEVVLLPENSGSTKKSAKALCEDPATGGETALICASSSDLSSIAAATCDLAITDPPFGNNLFYGDLADFFYVWMRLPLLRWYQGMPERAYFEPERTPRAIEAVQNSVEHPDDREEWESEPVIEEEWLDTIRQAVGDPTLQIDEANPLYRREPASQFYCNTLTACWAETARLLKPGGLMAFTFHHSADAPWVDVLEALFNAGFVLVATYPIRSDETKGAGGAFGSRKIEYDIVHVCRKRLDSPEPVAWAAMRRWVKAEAARYKELLEHVHGQDLTQADLMVILRGKALEFFSRHYGQVLTGDGQILGVRDALLGINLLLDDLVASGEEGALRPPDNVEPASRLYLSLFSVRADMSRDELSKTLRGTGVEPNDLQARGWLRVVGTKVHAKPIGERFTEFRVPGRTRKAVLKTDLDQAHFLIGLATLGSGLKFEDEMFSWGVNLKRSTDAILEWYSQTAKDKSIREAAERALRLVVAWRNRPIGEEAQMPLFNRLEAQAEAG